MPLSETSYNNFVPTKAYPHLLLTSHEEDFQRTNSIWYHARRNELGKQLADANEVFAVVMPGQQPQQPPLPREEACHQAIDLGLWFSRNILLDKAHVILELKTRKKKKKKKTQMLLRTPSMKRALQLWLVQNKAARKEHLLSPPIVPHLHEAWVMKLHLLEGYKWDPITACLCYLQGLSLPYRKKKNPLLTNGHCFLHIGNYRCPARARWT